MRDLRVVFMGTPEFAIPSLETILEAGYPVPLVVTAPDRPRGRGQKTEASPVRNVAEQHGLEVATPEKLKSPEFEQTVRDARPDVICVVAFRILPETIFSIPPRGSFNLHASLLPKYRGAAPINWAIINGETQTGVTTFFLKPKVDTGSIILQREVPIPPEANAGELHDALMLEGAVAVRRTLECIEEGEVETVVQDDTQATSAPKIFRSDCRIDWSRTAREVHDRIRGLAPRPGAFSYHGERLLKILRAKAGRWPAFCGDLAPGEVWTGSNMLLVGTWEGQIMVEEIQLEGKRAMSGGEFLRGYSFQPGDVLSGEPT